MKLILENWNKYLIEEEIENHLKQKRFESQKQLREFLFEEYQKRGIYLTEKQLNEKMSKWMKRLGKMGAGVALAGSLMGAAAPSQAYAADSAGDADAPAQQQQAEEEAVSKVVDNGNGTFSYTAQSQITPGMSSAASTFGASAARQALQDAGHDLAGSRVSQTATSGGVMYVTVTTMAVGG